MGRRLCREARRHDGAAEIVIAADRAEAGQGGQPARASGLHVKTGGFAVFRCGGDIGIFLDGDFHGFTNIGRQAGQGRRLRQIGRHFAHLLDVAFLGADQIGFSIPQIGAGLGEACFGLGDIGAGQIANFEPVLRGAQIDLEVLHIVAVELNDLGVAQHVVISGDNLAEHAGFGGAQRFLAGSDTRIGGLDAILHQPALIDGHSQLALRLHGARDDDELAAGDQHILVEGGIDGGCRQAGGALDRHRLVRRHLVGAGGVQCRVGLIGLCQRALQCFSGSRRQAEQRHAEQSGGNNGAGGTACPQTKRLHSRISLHSGLS